MNAKKQGLKKLKPESEKRIAINAFDCETHGLTGKEVFVTWATEFAVPKSTEPFAPMATEFDGFDFDEFTEFLANWGHLDHVSNEAVWYAHNMPFDMIRLLPKLRKRFTEDEGWEISIGYTGSKVYQVKVGKLFEITKSGKKNYKPEFTFRDSMALLTPGTSLADFAKSFSVGNKKLVGTIDFDAGEMFDVTNEQHLEYARKDATVLRDSVIGFDKKVHELFQVHVRGTASSTALAAWQVTFVDKNEAYYPVTLNSLEEKLGREAYKGGLVFLGKNSLKTQPACKYDLNSAYPYVMRAFGVPGGKGVQTREYLPGDVGCYWGKFTSDKQPKVAVTLARDDDNRLLTPTNDFEGVFTNVDIEVAVSQGYKFECFMGVQYPENKMIKPFNAFVDKCEAERIRIQDELTGVVYESAEYEALKAEESIVKLMQNGVYGKFGTKRISKSAVFATMQPDGYYPINPERVSSSDKDDSAEVEANLHLLLNGQFWEEANPQPAITKYSIPHWAAFITAHVRRELSTMFIESGIEDALYGDTDSISVTPKASAKLKEKYPDRFVKSEANLNGKQYGFFKDEGDLSAFRVVAPKVYAGKKVKDGSYTGASKGVPKKAIGYYGLGKEATLAVPYEPRKKVIKANTEHYFKDMLENLEHLQRQTFEVLSTSNFESGCINNVEKHSHRHLSSLGNSARNTVDDLGHVSPRDMPKQARNPAKWQAKYPGKTVL